jgi:hypothetical protein
MGDAGGDGREQGERARPAPIHEFINPLTL